MRRERDLNLTKYDISRFRYRELKNFCLQYPDKVKALNRMRDIGSPPINSEGHGSGISNPTERKAFKTLELRADIDLIERCLKKVTEGETWAYKPLKSNVTESTPFERLDLPCERTKFYTIRRAFFWELDQAKSERNCVQT